MRASLLTLLALFLLTACNTTASLKELRHAQPSSDPYQAALAEFYQQYAEEKIAAYDWWTSKYFADKGLMANDGRDIEPENATRWAVPQTMQPTFAEARDQLVTAVTASKAINPRTSAEAVVDYDRWVVLQSDGWDTAKIEEARDRFYAALGQLETQATGEQAPQPVETTSTVLYFPFDSSNLTSTAQAALGELVKYIRTAGPVKITINGHADRVGSDSYNMALSEQRAVDVMKALEQSGIAKGEMQYFAFGETDPAVAETEGVPEPRNRRVQIFLE